MDTSKTYHYEDEASKFVRIVRVAYVQLGTRSYSVDMIFTVPYVQLPDFTYYDLFDSTVPNSTLSGNDSVVCTKSLMVITYNVFFFLY